MAHQFKINDRVKYQGKGDNFSGNIIAIEGPDLYQVERIPAHSWARICHEKDLVLMDKKYYIKEFKRLYNVAHGLGQG